MKISTRRGSRPASTRSPSRRLMESAGRADYPEQQFEQLENRVLLSSPPFDDGIEITLNAGSGEGTATDIIDFDSDEGHFYFDALDDDFVTILADTIATGSSLDTHLQVYDDEGILLSDQTGSGILTAGTPTDAWVGFVASIGQRYYVRVLGETGGPIGDYTLHVDALTTALTLDIDGIAEQPGTISYEQDGTVFKLTTGSGAASDSLIAAGAKADASDLDTHLDIYDSTGQFITLDRETGRLTNAFAPFKGESDSVYYIRVRSDEFAAGEDLATGAFTLKVLTKAVDVEVSDVTRLNDTTGIIEDGLDFQLYWFESQGTGLTFVTSVGIPVGMSPPLPDPALRLYDDTGDEIGFNKLGGAAEIQIQLEGGNRFWVVVEQFDGASGGGFGVWVESHHTFDPNVPIDDHADSGDFANATPLIWGDPFQLTDAAGNPIGDRPYVVQASGMGRIHEAGDSDLFSFVPPVDMLSDYTGNDDDLGSPLFIGGAGSFDIKLHETRDFIGMWDAFDQWAVGLALDDTVRALTEYDPDGDGGLRGSIVAGGDFLTIDTPLLPTTVNHVAQWAYDPLLGRYKWFKMGSGFDGPVHALTVFDLDGADGPNPATVIAAGEFTGGLAAWDPVGGSWSTLANLSNGDDPAIGRALTVWNVPQAEGESIPALAVGGEFSRVGTTNANNVAYYMVPADADPSWNAATSGTDGPVYALAEFDPPDSDEDEIPPVLVVGGEFDNAGGSAKANIAIFTGDTWEAMGTGMDGAVYALTSFDHDGPEEDVEPITLVAGGAFRNPGSRIAEWLGTDGSLDGTWATMGDGMNRPVHALHVFTDREYGVGFNPSGDRDPGENIPVLYAGGEFTMAGGEDALRTAMWQYDLLLEDYAWLPMGDGWTDTVYAFADHNDELPGQWDRDDRTATLLQIILSPTRESFANTFLSVYDSNFDLLYTNDTIAPPFPDPAGMIDPSMSPGTAFPGIQVWGGETYYIQVTSVGSTGRYAFTVQADGSPDDGDGPIYDFLQPSDAFATASEISLQQFSGDGRNYTDNLFSAYNVTAFDTYPSGFAVVEYNELGGIEFINDADMYKFRAPSNGTAEIRIATQNINDEMTEVITDLVAGTSDVVTKTKTYNSALDATIRIYSNDFTLIATNSYNPAVHGVSDTTYMGTFMDRTFLHTDPRAVFDVVQGDEYFILIESSQKSVYQNNPDNVDWQHALGSYELMVNTMPDLNFDDDHVNNTFGLGTVIPIVTDPNDPANGTGSTTGVIDHTIANPDDTDFFEFYAIADGEIEVTVTAQVGSTLFPEIFIFDSSGFVIADGRAFPNNSVTVDFAALQGDRFAVWVQSPDGVGEGAYTVSISGPTFSDDYANAGQWPLAQEIEIIDFLDSSSITGQIENAGDSDLFMFTAGDFDFATVSITSQSSTLNPFLRVYEVGEDLVENPVYLRIAYNDDDPTSPPDSKASFSVTAGRPYYILVDGADPEIHKGDYTITVELQATDDHADADQFDLSTFIVIDTVTGQGTDTGTLEFNSDNDLFRFIAPAGGPLTVTISTPDSDLDPTVSLYDSDQSLVGTGTTIQGTAIFSDPSFFVTRSQQYYVLVDADGATTTGDYIISVTAPALDDHPNISEWNLATKVTLTPSTGDGLVTGVVDPIGDTDLFTFDSLIAGSITITVDTPSSLLNAQLRIYDASQTLIADVTGTGPDDPLTTEILAADSGETFYALVNGAFISGASLTGGYTITFNGPSTPPPPGDDDHADAGEFDQATPISPSVLTGHGSAIGSIETAGDTDLFTFSSLSTGVTFVEVVTPKGTLLDVAVRIFDPSQTQIAADSAGVPGANAYVTFPIDAPNDQYYIEVDGLSAGTGAYTLRISTSPETYFLYYPEGFAGSTISEFASIANPNDFAVNYVVKLRYEVGEPETIAATGVIEGGARGGVTLSDRFSGGAVGNVRGGTPYAIIIESDAPLGATLSHYDFGVSTGEAFTARTSEVWSFSEGHRDPGDVFDFIVFYNPNDTASVVTMTVHSAAGEFTLSKTVDAYRRGGWNINDTTALPVGDFAITVTSRAAESGDEHIGIVTALTHFNATDSNGFGLLGNPDGGATDGVITSLTNGDAIVGTISFYNPNSSTVAVTLNGQYLRANLPDLTRVVDVPAGSLVLLTGDELGLIANQPIGLRYEAALPVTITGSQVQGGDADATASATEVGTTFYFGDAFINADAAGTIYQEYLSFYNPADADLTVDVTLFFSDRTSATVTIDIDANGFGEMALHELAEILDRGGNNFFSIVATANSTFAVTMSHYDLFLGGGWTTNGAPLGLLNPISDAIS